MKYAVSKLFFQYKILNIHMSRMLVKMVKAYLYCWNYISVLHTAFDLHVKFKVDTRIGGSGSRPFKNFIFISNKGESGNFQNLTGKNLMSGLMIEDMGFRVIYIS